MNTDIDATTVNFSRETYIATTHICTLYRLYSINPSITEVIPVHLLQAKFQFKKQKLLQNSEI